MVGYTGEGLREVPAAVASAFSKRFGTSPAEMAVALGAKPGDDHFVTLPAAGDGPRIVVVGLESRTSRRAEDLRRSAGAGVRHAAGMAGSSQLSVAVALGSTDAAQAQAVAEGALLGSYGYTPISGKVNDQAGGIEAITVVHGARDKLDGVAGAAETVARAVVIGSGVGEHPGQPALSRLVRRPGPRAGRPDPDRHRRPRRERAGPGRLRRPAGRRRRVVPAAPAGPAELPAARGQGPPRPGRQGDHLRHRRAEPQAGRGHVHHEVRHGRSRRGAGRDLGDRPAGA